MNVDRILSASPWIEVFVKNLYWRSSLVHKFLAPRARNHAKPANARVAGVEYLSFDRIIDQLRTFGVQEGDIAIVHSSGSALKSTGLSPAEICERLLKFLGPEGTLALPAIPLLREEPTGLGRLTDAICTKRLVYDVRRTPPWTGAIPKALLAMSGTIRSRHPLNTMAAVGPHAAPMMKANIDGDRPTACGPRSSWKYCADHNAKIVCLGVDTAHSLTMIHVAEDSWAERWPIANWYRDRLFHVQDGEFEVDLTVRERRPHWAMYYGERTLQKELIGHGILKVANVDGLRIESCESTALVEFLNARKAKAYPYWLPFWTRSAR
ncbi:MAG: AAC(3) family N-acetyltransferase [Aromatoleum sp.]|jgi:aminoglycoside 3-N-acetyltransferase|uniref:AAC(3) family N-acetyltransferase n=1 Tax=Aromatoleum sp. TaxID=2307007 RepID=UPI002893CB08|nr:AAC(3) family N-acetyltransferase [Aromatoleum sp.]MDT3671430.1 AAC(3) family N-acetyltransferase [Aromatoleum sp.]